VVGSENSIAVSVFRQYRDRLLAKSANGLALSYLYYSHAPELNHIVASNPQLAAEAKILVAQVLPSVENSLKYQTSITLSRAQHAAAFKLLLQIQTAASPRLQKALGAVMHRLALNSDPLSPLKIQFSD
jgi:hypothetical protein